MNKVCISLLFSIVAILSCKKTDTGSGGGIIIPPPGGGGATVSYKNFYVDGNNLRDSSKHLFVMRGNNFPVFWFPALYKPSLAAASSLGANSARLVWQLDVQAWTPALSVLDEALAACVTNKLVPIVELHDFTGGTSASNLTAAANYFVRPDVKLILDKYTHVLIINIANEWGDGSVNELAWKNAYIPAISIIRNAGYKVPIMIDAPGYGQNENAIVQYGADLLNSDPLKNIIFSTHAYSNWNNNSTYSSRINAMLNKGLCIVFGEFGWDVPAAQQPSGFLCKVDAPLLMQLCNTKAVGYLGWSWTGNDANNACFDMSSSWTDTTHLTTWGKQWAYDVNGIKNTGVKAFVYQ